MLSILYAPASTPTTASPSEGDDRRRVDRDPLGDRVGLAREDGGERDGVVTTVARRVLS